MLLKAKIYPEHLAEILKGDKTVEYREIEGLMLACSDAYNVDKERGCGKDDCGLSVCKATYAVLEIVSCKPTEAEIIRRHYKKVPWKGGLLAGILLGERVK